MLSQSAIKSAWGPRCAGPYATISLHGTGKVTMKAAAVEAVKALNACLVTWNYRTIYAQTGAQNCRPKVGGGGWSIHAYGAAMDINWLLNPYGGSHYHMPYAMAAAICRIRTNNGKQVWNWGGFWSGTRDWMHFEIVCSPRDLATGINWGTVQGRATGNVTRPPVVTPPKTTTPTPEIPTLEEDDDVAKLIRNNVQGHAEFGKVYSVHGFDRRHVTAADYQLHQFFSGKPAECDLTAWNFFMNNTTDVSGMAGVMLTVIYIRSVVDRIAAKLKA